jgi:hypothetical protein
VTEFVLKERDQTWFGNDEMIKLFLESRLAPLEIRVEVHEDGKKGDPILVGAVPMVHVRLEALSGTIAIHPKAIIEAVEH